MQEETPAAIASRRPRSVAPGHALLWFAEAIRLWKRAPLTFSLMAVVVLALSIVLDPVPIAGLVASNVVAPLLACGFLYASLAADRESRPRFAHLFAVFASPLRAQVAVVASGLVVTAVEGAFAWYLADINLFLPVQDASSLSGSAVMAIYAAGVAASLPLTFVPMAVLFDGESPRDAFASSLQAFALNMRALASLGIYTYVLLMAGIVTTGVGLVLGLPWIAAASYAAWKDVFDVPAGRPASD